MHEDASKQIAALLEHLQQIEGPGRELVHAVANLVARQTIPKASALNPTTSAEIARSMARSGVYAIEMTLRHEPTTGWTISETKMHHGDRMLDTSGPTSTPSEEHVAPALRAAAQHAIETVNVPGGQVAQAQLMVKRSTAPKAGDGPRIEIHLELNAQLH